MDQIRIGKFIAEMRKVQGLTQKELADELGLSDKTISKWECGKGLPDNSIMIKLCEMLDISVNELLSGERIASGDYNRKAEENMMNLIQETRENKDNGRRNIILTLGGEVAIILIICYAMLLASGIGGFSYYFLDIPAFLIIIGMTFVMLLITKLTKAFFRAFELFVKIDDFVAVQEIKRSLQAVKLVIATVIMSGVLIMVTSIVACLYRMAEVSTLGPTLATACIGIFYSIVISLCLTPIVVKLKLKLNERV